MAGASRKRNRAASSAGVDRKSRKRSKHLGENLESDEGAQWRVEVVPKTKSQKNVRGRTIQYERHACQFDRTLDLNYAVASNKDYEAWRNMKSYKRFELPGKVQIGVKDIVYINNGPVSPSTEAQIDDETSSASNDETSNQSEDEAQDVGANGAPNHSDHDAQIEGEQRAVATEGLEGRIAKRDDDTDLDVFGDDWVAQVLECRASSPSAVYLRVCWLYRRRDFGPGQEPSHAEESEVFPSNHMDIIEAATVNGIPKTFRQWNEQDESLAQPPAKGIYWRQTYNCLTGKLNPPLQTCCVCKEPARRRDVLVKCQNCNSSMHEGCIKRDAKLQALRRSLSQTSEAADGPNGETTSGQGHRGNKALGGADVEKDHTDGSETHLGQEEAGGATSPSVLTKIFPSRWKALHRIASKSLSPERSISPAGAGLTDVDDKPDGMQHDASDKAGSEDVQGPVAVKSELIDPLLGDDKNGSNNDHTKNNSIQDSLTPASINNNGAVQANPAHEGTTGKVSKRGGWKGGRGGAKRKQSMLLLEERAEKERADGMFEAEISRDADGKRQVIAWPNPYSAVDNSDGDTESQRHVFGLHCLSCKAEIA